MHAHIPEDDRPTPNRQTPISSLEVNASPPAGDVPVFSCLVSVMATETGVRARRSSLAGFEFTAASERTALQKIVPAFKSRVAEIMQSGKPVPWLDPPLAIAPGEQQRFIPVHL